MCSASLQSQNLDARAASAVRKFPWILKRDSENLSAIRRDPFLQAAANRNVGEDLRDQSGVLVGALGPFVLSVGSFRNPIFTNGIFSPPGLN